MKKNIVSKIAAFVLAGVVAMTPVNVFADRDVKPTRIDKISSTSKTVDLGKKFELKVYTKEYDVEDDYFVWSSSNENVVALWDDENYGDEMEFKALKPGTATITCEIEGTNVKKTCKVTVREKRAYIDVDDEDRFEVEIGDREGLDAVLRNSTSKNKTLVYKSMNTSIATVDKRGNVYGKKEGTTKIQISSKANPAIKKTVTVYVVWED